MTDEQKAAVRALGRCTFQPASADKRFVRQMGERLAACPERPLTENQAARLSLLLHRYRRQHRECRCPECVGRMKEEPIRKMGCGNCPCGAVGTLFGRRGSGKPPVCAVCAGILQPGPPPPVPHTCVSLPSSPYPWLMEERPDRSRVRRVCLACGEAEESCAQRRGRVTTFPGFAAWYRAHIRCGAAWAEMTSDGTLKGAVS